MLRTLKISSVGVFLLLALSVLSHDIHAQPPTTNPADEGKVISKRSTKKEARETLAYWTKERMLAAKPMPLPKINIENVPATETAVELGAPGSAPGGGPSVDANRVARTEFPDAWSSDTGPGALEETETVQGTAGVFDIYMIGDEKMRLYYPWKAIGKLFSSGGPCTAAVISPNNIIVTAAHCVYDTSTNTWYKNFSFAPAFYRTGSPYGTFAHSQAKILSGWVDETGKPRPSPYDVALLKLRNNAQGRPVTFYTGWLGRQWGVSATQHMHSYGYPENLGGGVSMFACEAESYTTVDLLLRGNIGMGCSMTHGSSGGPWLRVFRPYESGNKNFVNSVVSGFFQGESNVLGPIFTSANIGELCKSMGC